MKLRLSGLIGAIFLFPALLFAAPELIHYQAQVRTNTGVDLEGPVTVGLRIYGTPGGTTVLWGETQNLTAVKGIISADLGKVNPLLASLFSQPELYLGVTVAGDPEMTPRERLASAWKAMSTNRAGGKAVQAGGANLTVNNAASGSVAVAFPQPFSSPPVVMVGASHGLVGSVNFIPTRVTEVTVTGCTVHFQSLGGATATGNTDFDWIAIGQ